MLGVHVFVTFLFDDGDATFFAGQTEGSSHESFRMIHQNVELEMFLRVERFRAEATDDVVDLMFGL